MPLQTLPCRVFQRGFALGARLLPWRTPTVLSGAGSLLMRLGLLIAPAPVSSGRQAYGQAVPV